MKAITTVKYAKVENADTELKEQGVLAFQIVKFIINFYGSIIETTHDTKIMKDGRQFVIGGCGFIPDNYEVAN